MSYGRFPQVGAAARWRVCALLAGCVLLLAATLSPAVAAPAATQAPAEAAQARPNLRQDATFTHITTEQGLSDRRIPTIVQDRAGFMWFGTNNGLNRFDGYTVVAYRHDPANPHSLSGNFIQDLYEDRSGTLWVGTRSGLNAFDRRTERFTRYRHDPADPRSLSNNTVIAIYEDRAGVLWRHLWWAQPLRPRHRHLYRLSPRPCQPAQPEPRYRAGDLRRPRRGSCGLARLAGSTASTAPPAPLPPIATTPPTPGA